MLETLKTAFFFPVASYFKFFARIRLNRWHPKIIVVTGSSGKTTLLSLIEAQLKDKARYSHHANSALGIPFDILGLSRKTLLSSEWLSLFALTPIKAFTKPFSERIYVVEADADRPNEGKFLAKLLHPDITLWLDIGRTHSLNFEKLVPQPFATVDKAIAYEFGHFLKNTESLAIVNADSELIASELKRTKARSIRVQIKDLSDYKLSKDSTEFTIKNEKYKFNYLLPEEIAYSIQATIELLSYLKIKPDKHFSNFKMPPGRSSILKGIKNTMLIDSTYNANLGSMQAVLHLFNQYPVVDKWVVLGDMLEQGRFAKEEHEKLADEILAINPEKIILIGKFVSQYTYPYLQTILKDSNKLQAFEKLSDVLQYLNNKIKGGEVILFKASQSIMLDAVVEHLLQNRSDSDKLCRREKYWMARRKQLGL
jgi:UDP-N-acetylmuramyl pentapeptide synthase